MSTGAVSSAQNLGRAAAVAPAPAPAPQTIMSGEKVTTTAAALKSSTGKTYHHQVPGASFFMPNGLQVQFLGGVFTTEDPEIIAELDKVANRNTSLIVSDVTRMEQLLEQDKTPAADAAANAAQ